MSNDLMMCGYVVRTAAKDIRGGVPLARCYAGIMTPLELVHLAHLRRARELMDREPAGRRRGRPGCADAHRAEHRPRLPSAAWVTKLARRTLVAIVSAQVQHSRSEKQQVNGPAESA